VETGGVETGGEGIGGADTGGVVTVVSGVGIALLPVAPATGVATSRPETAAERQRIFQNMVSLNHYLEKTCLNRVARL
jgi:hypothetical protein